MIRYKSKGSKPAGAGQRSTAAASSSSSWSLPSTAAALHPAALPSARDHPQIAPTNRLPPVLRLPGYPSANTAPPSIHPLIYSCTATDSTAAAARHLLASHSRTHALSLEQLCIDDAKPRYARKPPSKPSHHTQRASSQLRRTACLHGSVRHPEAFQGLARRHRSA